MNCHIREVAPAPAPRGAAARGGPAAGGAAAPASVADAFEFYDGKGFGHGVGVSQWAPRRRPSAA